jgi:hypothetical protein
MLHAPGNDAEPHRNPVRGLRAGRLIRIVVLIAAVVLLAVAIMVIPGWIPLLPRGVRRGLTEGLLRAVLAGYVGLFLVSAVATPWMAILLLRSRRARRSRPLLARGVLFGGSCLLSLVLLELGSTGWRLWMHRYPKLPVSFPEAQGDEFRIVVLGGSSALGEPYRPWVSVGQIVAWRLGEAMPARRFECEILAWLGDSLEDQHRKLASLERRPGMVIIYSGHNEFTARYEEERDGWLDEEPGNRFVRPVYRASKYSPFCRLSYELISKNRLDVGPSMAGRHQLIDSPQCSPAEIAEICGDFESRLEVLTSYCEQIGAVPVLIIPPANEADFEPSRSTLPASVSQEERSSLERDFSAARRDESSDAQASAERYRRILDRHPGFAEAHFRLAKLLERAGRRGAAAEHYLAALEFDGLPIRCTAPLREAYERVAARHARSILIDGRGELAAASSRKLLDDHVIQDTHHPTLRGQVALANAVLRELARKNGFGASYRLDRTADAAACALHFGLDAEKWAVMCERTSDHFRRVAGYRYDPTERLEKSRRYAEAAQKIRSGVAPERAGVPGAGVDVDERHGPRTDVLMTPAGSRRATHARSFGEAFDLPILEQDRRTPAQESDGCREMVSVSALDHFTGEPGERTVHDAHHRANRDGGLFRDDEAGVDHGVDLLKVAGQSFLIDDVEDCHEAVSAGSDDPILRLSIQEDVAWKERNDRLDPPSLRGATFLFCLRKIIGDIRLAQLAGNCLLLAGFGVQAPPACPGSACRRPRVFPQVSGETVGLGRKNGHRLVGSVIRRPACRPGRF